MLSGILKWMGLAGEVKGMETPIEIGLGSVNDDEYSDIYIDNGFSSSGIIEYAENLQFIFDYGLGDDIHEEIRRDFSEYVLSFEKGTIKNEDLIQKRRFKYGIKKIRSSTIFHTEYARFISKMNFIKEEKKFNSGHYGELSLWKKVGNIGDGYDCDHCINMSKKGWVRFNKPYSKGFMYPPFHIGCRCYTDYRLGHGKNKKPIEYN